MPFFQEYPVCILSHKISENNPNSIKKEQIPHPVQFTDRQ